MQKTCMCLHVHWLLISELYSTCTLRMSPFYIVLCFSSTDCKHHNAVKVTRRDENLGIVRVSLKIPVLPQIGTSIKLKWKPFIEKIMATWHIKIPKHNNTIMWAGCHQPALVGQHSIILCKQKIKNFVQCQIKSMHTWQVLRYIDLARANGETLLNILIV